MVTSKLVSSLLMRAARTFLQTFIAVVVASPALNLSLPGFKAAAVAGLASVLSMVNRLLDESPVPSLTDRAPAPPPAAAPTGQVPAPATIGTSP